MASKRKIETVDLTVSDDESTSSSSVPRPSKRNQGSQLKDADQFLPTPPRSSQPERKGRCTHPSSLTTNDPQSSASQPKREGRFAQPPSSAYPSPQSGASQSQPSQNGTTRNLPSSQPARSIWSDVDKDIDLTQDDEGNDDDYEDHELYGVLDSKVVGVRYYNGHATRGEYVAVIRDPQNQYDRNAIQVNNVMGNQIGHIPRGPAAKLAPLMDDGSLLVEGALTGHKGEFDVPIGLKLFGTRDPIRSAQLKQRMKDARLPVSELVKAEAERNRKAKEEEQRRRQIIKGGTSRGMANRNIGELSNAQFANLGMPDRTKEGRSMEQLLDAAQSYNPRDLEDAIRKFTTSEEALSNMQVARQPERISTNLLQHQLQGLKWMLAHEFPKLPNGNEVVQLWQSQRGGYMNVGTSYFTNNAPKFASGGILADDMGLGKTLQVLALIVADPEPVTQPTLIICPLSVMSNWTGQAAEHIKGDGLRILVYHGPGKGRLSPEDFSKYDLVITTYSSMMLDLFPHGMKEPAAMPTQNGLFSASWRRVVLDEGHQIRNPSAKMSRAACALEARSRWILTGTPIVNSLKDMYSNVKFLRLTGGLEKFEAFNANLIRPLKTGDASATKLLRLLMENLCLRRMKDMKFMNIKLPELTSHRYLVTFTDQERKRYEAFHTEAKGSIDEVRRAKNGNAAYAHLLEVLLRMRQCCNHWKMCGEDRIKNLLELVEECKVVNIQDPEKRRALQDLLQLRIDSQEECPICFTTLAVQSSDPVITACAHTFCTGCIERVIGEQQKCPMCRAGLPDSGSLLAPAVEEAENSEIPAFNEIISSSKIEALLEILRASAKQDDTKTVIFSQWTSFLNILEPHLQNTGMSYTRMDGTMNTSKRNEAMARLTKDSDCKIMLASLGVCSVGINLVAANQVILADSWWAPAIEDQAVDRVHRLGQSRDCRVVRLVVEDTIEEAVLTIQAEKRKLAGMAFGDKEAKRKGGPEKRGQLKDIMRLIE